MTNAQVFGRDWLQSSFVSPVPTPAYYPSDAPLVCVQFNADWLPLVIGCLTQLTQPAAWQGSDGEQDASVQCADDLIGIFSEAYGVGVCTMLRLTNGCELQESTDGGATWATVDGWDANAMSCFVGPPSVPGSVGPIGPSSPGVPPIQPGQTTSDLACSVSGYLAQNVIRKTIQFLISGVEASQAAADIATAIFTTFLGGPGLAILATTAVNGIYQAITGGTLADYEDAEDDDTLWSDITCAIFTATQSTGYVNDDNFADVVANVEAVSYAHPAVIAAIVAYLRGAGAIYLETVQIPGAIAVADCSGCADWCFEFDFTASSGGWTAYGAYTAYVPGVGFVGSYDAAGAPPNTDTSIQLLFSAVEIGSMEITYTQLSASAAGISKLLAELSSAVVSELDIDNTGQSDPYVTTMPIGGSADSLYAVVRLSGNVTPAVIRKVVVRGSGANPFGSTNC